MIVVAACMVMSSVTSAATFVTTLSGPAENPPNASPGTGSSTVVLDTAAHTLAVSVVFSGLSSPTTASHIHCCAAPPATAIVATTTPTFPGFPLGVTSGTYNVVLDTTQASSWNPAFITANGGTPLTAEATLAAGMAAGQAYLNVHTVAIPAGEIRGFLVAQAAASTNIPTLSEGVLVALALLLALSAFAVIRRRNG